MYEVLGNGQVLKVETIVTKTQEVINKRPFDMEYHVKLIVDKTAILADGIDTAKIKAKIYNYLDEPQDVAQEITIRIKGEGADITDTLETVNGEISFDFNTATYGQFTITASVPTYRSGGIDINAEAV
jgi:hypothetical protein